MQNKQYLIICIVCKNDGVKDKIREINCIYPYSLSFLSRYFKRKFKAKEVYLNYKQLNK